VCPLTLTLTRRERKPTLKEENTRESYLKATDERRHAGLRFGGIDAEIRRRLPLAD
jgi:hypothetical protein